jgi:hypothetical protein
MEFRSVALAASVCALLSPRTHAHRTHTGHRTRHMQTCGGRSVGIVRLRTKGHGVYLVFVCPLITETFIYLSIRLE